jgi:hypothetical protein
VGAGTSIAGAGEIEITMLGTVLLTVLLVAAPDVGALRQELEGVAERIEDLKVRRAAGESVDDELTGLLVRAQELADEIDRARAPAATATPVASDPAAELADELRARSAALRHESERLKQELAEVERRLLELRSGGTCPVSSTVERAAPFLVITGGEDLPRRPDEREILEVLRDGLAAGVRALEVQASILEAAAGELERQQRGE